MARDRRGQAGIREPGLLKNTPTRAEINREGDVDARIDSRSLCGSIVLTFALHLWRRFARPAAFCAGTLALAGALALSPAALAGTSGDLILLDGDPAVELQGTNNFGIVYVDTDVRLTGDTVINGTFIYFGPNARFLQCWDTVLVANQCQNGRHLTINGVGSVTINPTIDLRGTLGAPAGSGSLNVAGASVALNGSVFTSGDQAPPGNVAITSAGPLDTKSIQARGGAITLAGATGVTAAGLITTEADSSTLSGVPGQAASGGPIDITSTGGNIFTVDLRTEGINTTGAGLAGGNGGSVRVVGGDVRVGSVDTTGGTSTDAAGGFAGGQHLEARGALTALGFLDVSGSSSSNSAASGGGSITVISGGPAVLVSAFTIGTRGPLGGGGGAGGAINLSVASLTVGDLLAGGGRSSRRRRRCRLGATTHVSGGAGRGGRRSRIEPPLTPLPTRFPS